jgi:hypothetical protein
MKIKDVVARLSSNPAVWRQVRDELSASPDPQARFVAIAGEHGIVLDRGEIEGVMLNAQGELGDTELDSVSGGFNPQPDPPRAFSSVSSPYQQLVGLLGPTVNRARF